jgi:hypothetical protein
VSAVPDCHPSVTRSNPPSARTLHPKRGPLLLRILDLDVFDVSPAACLNNSRDDDLSAQLAIMTSPFHGGVWTYSYLKDLDPATRDVLSQHIQTMFPLIRPVNVSIPGSHICSVRDLPATRSSEDTVKGNHLNAGIGILGLKGVSLRKSHC